MGSLSARAKRHADVCPLPSKLLWSKEATRLRRYESDVFNEFELKTIISEQDRKLIDHPERDDIADVRNSVDPTKFAAKERPQQFDLVFTGNMSYPPNVRAASYIVKRVLPFFQSPMRVLIAGCTPTSEVKGLAGPSVTVSGWVDDITEAYASAKTFVAPMEIGTGLQNKILEAMAMQIPCVVSELGNRGVGAKPEREILIANSPQEFVRQIKNEMTTGRFRKPSSGTQDPSSKPSFPGSAAPPIYWTISRCRNPE